MEKLITYNQERFPDHYKFNNKTLKFEYARKNCHIRILKEVNDLRYCDWGLQCIWDLSICFPWGWINKTLRRKDDSDITKVIEYINKKLKKYGYIITDTQWNKIKNDFSAHMEDDSVFDKHSFNIKQGWNNGFNTGFLQCWEEYLIEDITKKEKADD